MKQSRTLFQHIVWWGGVLGGIAAIVGIGVTRVSAVTHERGISHICIGNLDLDFDNPTHRINENSYWGGPSLSQCSVPSQPFEAAIRGKRIFAAVAGKGSPRLLGYLLDVPAATNFASTVKELEQLGFTPMKEETQRVSTVKSFITNQQKLLVVRSSLGRDRQVLWVVVEQTKEE